MHRHGFRRNHRCKVTRRNFRIFLHDAFDEIQRAFAPPAEFPAGTPQPCLSDAVRKCDQAIPRSHRDLGNLHLAVRPALGNQFLDIVLRQVDQVPQMDKRRIVHFDHARLAAELHVEHRERGVADLADLAYGKRIHNRFGGLKNIHIGTDEFQSHCGCHARHQIRLDAAAEAVGQYGNRALLIRDAHAPEVIAAGSLPGFGPLARLQFYKELFIFHRHLFYP